ncbi:NAD(P)/FAD-dependent oxidoreductase [Thalassococcus sp. S3]|uniref:NAD(P)/FAD-dependent oxidoreductase n=1 Tax=Thalassococcus sp. S3 TaxID=2017482 RepID=UPI0010246BAF|nr:NAD(P)/FAD-dependent oxidoreductase [Thalassococcus sp. S3]QBF31248.1 aminoacetone oxidase family FAD-binding enzyme [Thalassococcus sp. S3]
MDWKTIILGAGAAGLMCASTAGSGVLVIDHAKAPGEKIRISGGGRCNFTNLHCTPEAFLSENPHFAKSALARYTQWDFIDLVDRHGIAWHEKTLGQLFCDGSAREIIAMLRAEMDQAGATLWLSTKIIGVQPVDGGFAVEVERDGQRSVLRARSLVLATGGKSIPKMGATGLAYDIARQFGLRVTETRPALVPLTFPDNPFKPLAGVSTPVRAYANGTHFDEAMLFTHRGLSGPAILQISSHWHEGEPIDIDLDPTGALLPALKAQRQSDGRRQLGTALSQHLPGRLVSYLGETHDLSGRVADQSDRALSALTDALRAWRLTPGGSEGYRTAEVTAGGIATDAFSSRTMECTSVPGLYGIGEAMDVTGWLGGYNFQWAWSSAQAAGRAISAT